ncbi:ATP-binding protein [Microbacterium sp. STN6]|uniref:sensor histidine kinase n=1 Tax=Microbacterium sp. STN6 TaxID=2995588 RepID=UPI00226092DE|nr:ATP-binding protein [Microbacterium sp. STN6]MCX7520910.1 ATP-binding protein [Microbacterium sp. STN6]
MSLGLPSHLARSANRSAVAAAVQAAGVVCLAVALSIVLIETAAGAAAGGGIALWPAIVSLVPMGVLLIAVRRRRRILGIVSYLIVGTFATAVTVYTLLVWAPAFNDTDLLVVALPVIAMIAVGGAAHDALTGVLWSTLGYALGECAVAVAAAAAGNAFQPELISLVAYLLLVAVMIFDAMVGVSRQGPQAAIHRAIRQDQVAAARHELAVEFAADLHDTVLSELLTLATSVPGELAPRLRRRIEQDLEELGRDPSTGRIMSDAADVPGSAWQSSELRAVVDISRDDGLDITVSGEREEVARLRPDAERAVAQAVRQCLVNVLRHAGTLEAEVAIVGDDGTVSVSVIDAGRGFVQAETRSDRMGLRTSVRERVERIGGSVDIWSSRDVGTTVILTVPVAGSVETAETRGPSEPEPEAETAS